MHQNTIGDRAPPGSVASMGAYTSKEREERGGSLLIRIVFVVVLWRLKRTMNHVDFAIFLRHS